MARTVYVDESGDDRNDLHFVVAGVAPDDTGPVRRALNALLFSWPFLKPVPDPQNRDRTVDPLKAARAAQPGWLAARYLASADAPTPPAPTLAQVAALSYDRARLLAALEGAADAGRLRDPAAVEAAGIDPLDVSFARWAAAVRQGAARVGAPPPAPRSPRALATWYAKLGLPPALDSFPRALTRAYATALQGGGGVAWLALEAALGARRGAPERYLRLLGPLLTTAHADGVGAAEVQGRDIPQPAAAGTVLAWASRPMTAADLTALGLPPSWGKVVAFHAVAERPGHLLADFAAWSLRTGDHHRLWTLPVSLISVD